ncbi:aegerolysin family protein [Nostoc sp. UIC 10630]|uniref:aegerolysin family protein n=1 Tax=unclassified Nostoc TaxID=2593658 RepID=UPI0013D73362|nr:aegerolysin family protein [Nostoc sp. UIC 10630]NEU84428.1 hypothetical protein [Nostoc sp. UIC 10630]
MIGGTIQTAANFSSIEARLDQLEELTKNQEERIKTLEEKINNQEELKPSTNTNVKAKEPTLWVSIQIKNTFNSDNIYIKNARLEFGKFVQNEDKYMEIGASDLLSTIPAGQTGTISSASRTNSASGTEGTIDLFDADVKIAQLYWNCPFGSQENTFKVIDLNSKDGYIVNVGDVNRSSALGIINVEVGFRH